MNYSRVLKNLKSTDPIRLRAGAAAMLCVLLACVPAAAVAVALDHDEPAADSGDAGSSAQVDTEDTTASAQGNRNFTWYMVAPDLRLCPSPLCGGYWVTRVNLPLTVCANGTMAARCYVAELDLPSSGLTPEQERKLRSAAGHLLVRGSVRPKDSPPFGNLGVLYGLEAWIGHAKVVPTGTLYRATGTSIVCITFPCPTVDIQPLNRRKGLRRIAGVDLSAIDADARDGYAQLDEPGGLLTAGELVPVSGPAGRSLELKGSEYYLPVLPEIDACGSLGLPLCGDAEFCNFPEGANCGRADAPGVCEPRPRACLAIFDPVCGCDGHTYGNSCDAHAAGVSVEYKGACGRIR